MNKYRLRYGVTVRGRTTFEVSLTDQRKGKNKLAGLDRSIKCRPIHKKNTVQGICCIPSIFYTNVIVFSMDETQHVPSTEPTAGQSL